MRRAPARSAGVLRQPVAHGAREPREADRRRTQVVGDTHRSAAGASNASPGPLKREVGPLTRAQRRLSHHRAR